MTREKSIEPAFARVLLSACAVGALAGLLASVFRSAVEWLQHSLGSLVDLLSSPTSLLASVLATALSVTVTLLLVRRFAPEAGGSGVQEVEGALEGTRPVRWRRLLPVKFVGGVLTLGSGMVAGREGPTVQMGANVGGMVHELFRLPRDSAHALLAAGAAAGLSAAFNAPLSGVLFVIEEMRPRFRYGLLSFQAVLLASACADVTTRLVTSQGPVFEFAAFPAPAPSTLWMFPLLGAALGLLGALFTRTLMSTLERLDRLREGRRLLAAAAIGGLVGLGSWGWQDATGGGYSAITDAVALRFATAPLLLLLVTRFGATVLSYGSGVPGGIFTPMLALGTLFGVALGTGVGALGGGMHPAVFAVVGMGTLFSAVVQAPLTGIALAMELTDSFDLVLPLLLACAFATLVARLAGGLPLYELLLARTLRTSETS